MPETRDIPMCNACGEPIGVYEPLWRVARGDGERTSLLRMAEDVAPDESLWHMDCARRAGVAA